MNHLPIELSIIWILHQTTTWGSDGRTLACCQLSEFYIKPQLLTNIIESVWVVNYLNSTSNHNFRAILSSKLMVVNYLNSTSNHNQYNLPASTNTLSIIWILHQTTTLNQWTNLEIVLSIIWILHQTTTCHVLFQFPFQLSIIWILHQTTTLHLISTMMPLLSIIWILHQTTT